MPTDRDWDEYYDNQDKIYKENLKSYYKEQNELFNKMSLEEKLNFLITDYLIRHAPIRR